jgi:hypothetical protein
LRSLLRTSSGDELWLEVVDDSWVPAVSTKEKKEPEKEAKQRRSCCQADAGLHARVRGSNSAGPAGRSFLFHSFPVSDLYFTFSSFSFRYPILEKPNMKVL